MKIINILIIRPFHFLWISILLFITGILFCWPVMMDQSPASQSIIFKKELLARSEFLKQSTHEFIKSSFTYNTFHDSKTKNELIHWEKNGFIFLVYKNDSLVFWSDNSTSFPIQSDSSLPELGISKFSNGWYLNHTEKYSHQYSITGLALIKHDYPYENQYLKNDYHSSFSSNLTGKLSQNPPGFPVSKKAGKTNIYYQASPSTTLPDQILIPSFLAFLFSFIIFFLFIFHLFRNISLFKKHQGLFFVSITAIIILARFVLFWFKIPHFLYNSILFSPTYFAASSWLPSLGDLLSNIIILLFLAMMFFRQARNLKPDLSSGSFLSKAFIFINTFIILLFYCFYLKVFDILVSNSSSSLTLIAPLTFTYPTLLSLIAVACLCVTLFLLIITIFRLVYINISLTGFIIGQVISVILLILFLHFQHLPLLVPSVIYLLFIVWLFYLLKSKKNPYSFPSLLFQIIVFSILSTYMLIRLDAGKESEKRRYLAQKLSSERDPLAEFLITEAYTSMKADKRLNELLKSYPEKDINEDAAIKYISDHYFGNYWSKYNLDFTLCTPDRILNVVIPDNTLINCRDYFSQLIKMIGKPTLSKNLSYLDYGSGSINYLATFPFIVRINNKTLEITLYIDITSKLVPKGLGYPELLISKETRFSPDINNYSYAIYKKTDLIRSYGKYPYPLSSQNIIPKTIKNQVFDANQYNHLVISTEKDKTIIISLKNRSIIDNIAPFSYFSLFLGILSIIILLFLAPQGSLKLKKQNFRYRLQLAMILLILFSFIIIGVTSGIYIVRLNYSKNIDNLTEKAHSVLTEIQQKLGKTNSLTPVMSSDLFYLLNKFSLVFFTDINLFDLNGNLIASSRPLIFEDGLISTKMNRQSFQELSINQRSLFIHEDKIGNYRFISAYLPFRNEQAKMIGYLNLPYFARQDEIRAEISAFLVAFVNIYVLLVVFSILVAILISRYITKPMLLIKNKISQVKLGKPNEKIDWNVEDEIGGLVAEYNAMIDKLSYSAEQLARSERESAWREMARQVAHEIKNPLTPMKLSVQLLLKAYDEKEPEWDQRLKRFSQTLIEQIDNLSHIAGSFSDFARMPELKKENINLYEICRSVIELHHHNDKINIITDFPCNILPIIQADSNQILRVFVNLFNNSLQAVDKEKQGEIRISLREIENFYEITFSDNGSGIPSDQQSKIFSPNFTTKSAGMGLGLAMVKNIMDDHGGDISFTSEAGKGTTFILKFQI